MEKQEETKLLNFSVKKVLITGLGFMSAMISWSFYNFKIPIILAGIDDGPDAWIRVGLLGTASWVELLTGIIMVLDNIAAIILQPYFGRLSDRLQSKYGRRTPFFLIGLPTAVGCMIIMPFAPLFGLVALIFIFNFAMAFYRSAVMSIMPDYVPANRRSTANSFIALMGGVGTVIGFMIPKLVEMIPGTAPVITGVLETQDYFWQDFWGFFLTGAFMLLCLILFLIGFREVPTGTTFWKLSDKPIVVDYETKTYSFIEEEAKEDENITEEIKAIFTDKDKSALYILLTIFLYASGLNVVEFTFGRFATSYLKISEGLAGVLIALIPVCLILAAYAAGSSGERNGRLKSMKRGLEIMILCEIAVIIMLGPLANKAQEISLTVVDLIPLVIALCIAGIGYAYANINALPVVWQIAPEDKIGAYTGIYYMFSSAAAIINPIVMGGIFSLLSEMGLNQWPALFPYMLLMTVLSRIVISKVKRGDAEMSKEKVKELREKYESDD